MATTKKLEMAYQPITHLSTNRTLYFEALLRHPHQDTGRLLARADAEGKRNQIERRALQLVQQDIKSGHIPSDTPVGVNISPRTLVEDLASWKILRTMAKQHPLYVEIIEDRWDVSSTELKTRIATLQFLGADVFLDDFGEGRSNILALLSLPWTGIKLDRGWQTWLILDNNPARDQVARQETAWAILRAIQCLGIPVVLEGIENPHTPDQIQLLSELHIHYGQGFYFCRPYRQVFLQRIPAQPG